MGSGLILLSQVSAQELIGAYTVIVAIGSLSLTYSCPVDFVLHGMSSNSFVSWNKAVQLTVAGGRITSVFNVRFRCVSFSFFRHFAWVVGKPTRVLMHVFVCGCELISQGQAGGLVIFEDYPTYCDAWGASHDILCSSTLLSMGSF